MEEKKLVPRRRFRGFEDYWTPNILENLSDVNSGQDYKHLEKGDVPVYGTGGYMLSVNDKLSSLDGVGIGRKGTIDKPVFLKAPYWTVDTLFYMLPKEEINIHFLYYLSKNIKWKNYDESTGVPSLSRSTINNIRVFITNLKEQQKIGEFFKVLDDRIANQERKIAKVKALKEAYLTEMFPQEGETVPRRRFKGFEGEWEWKKIKGADILITDGNYGELYPSSADLTDSLNGIPFLRGSDIKNGYLNSTNSNFITKQKNKELTSGQLKRDDIVIAVRGSLGTVGYAKEKNIGWNINSQLAILRTNKDTLHGFYLYQYLSGNYAQSKLKALNTGSALKQLSINQLMNFLIPITNFNEQQKIGTFFKNLDDQIRAEESKLEKLKKMKKAYLEEMFV